MDYTVIPSISADLLAEVAETEADGLATVALIYGAMARVLDPGTVELLDSAIREDCGSYLAVSV